jgi:hypothetical protein
MIRNVGTKDRVSRQVQNSRIFLMSGDARRAAALNPSIVVTNLAPSPATALVSIIARPGLHFSVDHECWLFFRFVP